MYLTIDIGNTRIKYQYWDEDGQALQDGNLSELWELESLLLNVKSVAISNVRGVSVPNWDTFKGHVLNLSGKSKLPFKLAYKTPETLGSDRIAAIAGALKLYPAKNVLCIDAGTCLKFDFIDEYGCYLGGSISPGLKMRYQSLNHYTGKLPEIKQRPWIEILGQSTEESILAGVQGGFIGETASRIQGFTEKYRDLHIVITGGDADFLEDMLKMRIFAEPLLIHRGLLFCLLSQ